MDPHIPLPQSLKTHKPEELQQNPSGESGGMQVHSVKKLGGEGVRNVFLEQSSRVSANLEQRVVEHKDKLRALFEKKWNDTRPGYGQRLKCLVKSCVTTKEKLLPLTQKDVRDPCLDEDSFKKWTKDVASSIKTKAFDKLQYMRNILGAPVTFGNAYVNLRKLRPLVAEHSRTLNHYAVLQDHVQGVSTCHAVMTLFSDKNNQALTFDEYAEPLKKVLSYVQEIKASSHDAGILMTDAKKMQLNGVIHQLTLALKDKTQSLSKETFSGVFEALLIASTGVIAEAKTKTIEALVEFNIKNMQHQSLIQENIEVIKTRLKQEIETSLNEMDNQLESVMKLYQQHQLNHREINYYEGEMAYSVAIFCKELIGLVAATFGFVGLFKVPVVTGVALLCKFCSNVLQALFQKEGFSLKLIDGYKDYDMRMKAEAYIQQHKALDELKTSEDMDLNLLALVGAAKSMQHQKDGVKWVLGSVFSLVGLVGTVATLLFVTASALTMAGLVSGALLAFASPVGWMMFSLVVGTGLAFGLYCVGRNIYRMKQASRWEGLLKEAIDGGVPANMGAVNQRSALYNQLFSKGYAKLSQASDFDSKSFNQVHGYVMRRAFMRVMRYQPALCVDMVYAGLKNDEQSVKEFMQIFMGDDTRSTEAFFDQVRNAREDQASFLKRDIQKFLGF